MKKMHSRGVTGDGAKILVGVAHNSIRMDGGAGTRSEIYMLLEEHRFWNSQLESDEKVLVDMTLKVEHVAQLLAIKGVEITTITGLIAEAGDIRRFIGTG